MNLEYNEPAVVQILKIFHIKTVAAQFSHKGFSAVFWRRVHRSGLPWGITTPPCSENTGTVTFSIQLIKGGTLDRIESRNNPGVISPEPYYLKIFFFPEQPCNPEVHSDLNNECDNKNDESGSSDHNRSIQKQITVEIKIGNVIIFMSASILKVLALVASKFKNTNGTDYANSWLRSRYNQ